MWGATEDFIVVMVPVKLKSLVEPIENLIEHAESTARSMSGRGAVDYAKVEEEVSQMTGAIECAVHALHLSKLDVDAPTVEIHGKRYAWVGRSTGDYYTRTGTVKVPRSLYRESSAAAQILEHLRQSGCEHHAVGIHQPVHDAITYLENHSERLNYANARRNGLPIGSGNVEATCKTLVGIRMKLAGSRWKERTGEHIIRLRALGLSDRWDSAMDKLHATYRTSVGIAA